jgi:signal transduction histidine kinase
MLTARGDASSRREAFVNALTSRRLRLIAMPATALIVVASVAYGLAAGASASTIPSILIVCGTFIGTGFVAWARRPANRIGPLMVLEGWALLLMAFGQPVWPLIIPAGLVAYTVSSALLGYLLLAYPSGVLGSPANRALVGLTAVLLGGSRALQLATVARVGLAPGVENPYHLIDSPSLAASMATVPFLLDLAILSTFVAFVIVRWIRSSRPTRRLLTPVAIPAIGLLLVLFASTLLVVIPVDAAVRGVLGVASLLARVAVPIGFLIGLLRIQMARSAVADLVVELGGAPTPARLRDALASALGDPTLEVGQWSTPGRGYVDAEGRHLELPTAGADRGVTLLERDGEPLAAILHDPVLLDDPGLVAAVASALRLAVENERLHGKIEAQLDEVRASRARIVEAGDAERKRVERDLHDGAQQRLVGLSLALRLARTRAGSRIDPALAASLDDASAEARAALAELRELARGIHPQILTGSGLGPALQSLAHRSPIETTVDVAGGRYPAAVEGAAYFAVSEALANVSKYANADHVLIRGGWAAGTLTIEVADDGIGGADEGKGTGLRGLADRLAAVNGTLDIDSPKGGGTRLLARIPTLAPTESAA